MRGKADLADGEGQGCPRADHVSALWSFEQLGSGEGFREDAGRGEEGCLFDQYS